VTDIENIKILNKDLYYWMRIFFRILIIPIITIFIDIRKDIGLPIIILNIIDGWFIQLFFFKILLFLVIIFCIVLLGSINIKLLFHYKEIFHAKLMISQVKELRWAFYIIFPLEIFIDIFYLFE
jgi:hypothetical protein